jgi:hypothetical protein
MKRAQEAAVASAGTTQRESERNEWIEIPS